MNRLAIIRVRGTVKIKKKINGTMKMLRLYRKNSCSIVSGNKNYIGMLNEIKDFVTWGEINKEAFKILLRKRGRLAGNKTINDDYIKEKLSINFDQFTDEFFEFKRELRDIPGLKLFFRLKPPIKGFERNGIKKPYSLGGSLGYRKDKINELIVRMV